MILSSPGAVAFLIFGFPVYYYGITMACALLAGYFTADFLGKKIYSINLDDFFIPLVLIGFLGARLYYCFLNWGYYGQNLIQILNFRGGGLSIHGGIFASAIFLFCYCKYKKNSFWNITAPLCVALPLAQSIGRWGNFFNSEAFGRPFDGLIKLYVPQYLRPVEFKQFDYFHPTVLYESIADILIFIILLWCIKRKQNPMFVTCLYLILYSVVRIFIEIIRIDSVFSPFGIPIAIIISSLIFIFALVGLILSKKFIKIDL